MEFGIYIPTHSASGLQCRDESACLFDAPMHQMLVIAKLIRACQEVYSYFLVISIEKNDPS